jgi:hypothetical protein
MFDTVLVSPLLDIGEKIPYKLVEPELIVVALNSEVKTELNDA